MPARKLRWGVLSTANIGIKAVLPAIQTSDNGELAAIASRDGARAQGVANELGIPKAYGSYEALIEADGIDAIYNPLPNSLHKPWTIRALEAGKHVLCEKPLALNAPEAKDMAEVAQKTGRLLMEAFMYRFHPRTRGLLELVRSGAVGELRLIRGSFTFRLRRENDIRLEPELGGGALYDVGCYCLHLSRTLCGEAPDEVTAQALWTERDVDESLTATLHFPSGVLAHFDCSLGLERQEFAQVVGTKGRLELENPFGIGQEEAVIVEKHQGQEDIVHRFPAADKYRLMVEHFAESALKGKALHGSTEDAIANMQVIDRLYEEARATRR